MKDTFLNIIIIFLLSFLIVSFYTDGQKKQEVSGNTFSVSSLYSSYAIPAEVVLTFSNETSSGVTFNMCRDMEISLSGEVKKIPEKECADISLQVGEKKDISLAQLFPLFDTKGQYIIKTKIASKEIITPIEVVHKGSISKLFIALFYAPIYNFMIFLIEIFHYSLGWATITVTILIRLLLLWPQHKMMMSQKKLQNIQPKIKDLQDKHKGDAQKLGLELMNLYKKEQVNPMGSCGLLLIQMPILLVIYNVLISINSTTNYFYLYPPLQNFRIEDINTLFYGLDLLGVGGVAGAILALSVGVVQFIQIKLSLAGQETPPSKGLVLEKKLGDKDYNSFLPDQQFMNKFMLYGMPGMVVAFTYSFSAGVGLYWGISTLFGIFQQLFVNNVLKK